MCTYLYVVILFIKFKYIPNAFMQSVIIPLIKCKSGDLTDVNNYRAIAISCYIAIYISCYPCLNCLRPS